MEEILEGRGVGVALKGLSPAQLAQGVERLLALADKPGIHEHCRRVALDLFSVANGVSAYAAIYEQLAEA